MGRLIRAPAEAFPNAAIVDVANLRPSKGVGRNFDETKMRDAIRVDALLGSGNIQSLL